MDPVSASNNDATNTREVVLEGNPAEADDYKNKVDQLFSKVEEVSIWWIYNGLNYHDYEYCAFRIYYS